MKTITCRAMGGPCDAPITGSTPDEMMMNGMTHMKAAHPEMAADIEAMPKDDPKMVEWSATFAKTWAETPETPAEGEMAA